MVKKCIAWILLIALTNYLMVGCTRTGQYKLLKEEFGTTIASEKITGVVTSQGKRYEFKSPGRYLDVPYMIKGYLADGQLYSIALGNKGLTEIRTGTAETIPVDQAGVKTIKEIIGAFGNYFDFVSVGLGATNSVPEAWEVEDIEALFDYFEVSVP